MSRTAARTQHTASLAFIVTIAFMLSSAQSGRALFGDRALVPRAIRSGATPHHWIVADPIVRSDDL